jgi:hypothetical protein
MADRGPHSASEAKTAAIRDEREWNKAWEVRESMVFAGNVKNWFDKERGITMRDRISHEERTKQLVDAIKSGRPDFAAHKRRAEGVRIKEGWNRQPSALMTKAASKWQENNRVRWTEAADWLRELDGRRRSNLDLLVKHQQAFTEEHYEKMDLVPPDGALGLTAELKALLIATAAVREDLRVLMPEWERAKYHFEQADNAAKHCFGKLAAWRSKTWIDPEMAVVVLRGAPHPAPSFFMDGYPDFLWKHSDDDPLFRDVVRALTAPESAVAQTTAAEAQRAAKRGASRRAQEEDYRYHCDPVDMGPGNPTPQHDPPR